uniref:Beta-adaptin appendage C-terminal subdomain domain-containing protein n=1 Tax=Aplanochytrium stocchinoi TaxID=215587 RepID=A0A7S3LHH6_9STRA|mmetsp:Transcript_12908/g.14937  ORF Transcript_12908/g.14937 Transcript_12908/m.14937 type:complete len:408 (+) Transcript_12908:405-1628(+)
MAWLKPAWSRKGLSTRMSTTVVVVAFLALNVYIWKTTVDFPLQRSTTPKLKFAGSGFRFLESKDEDEDWNAFRDLNISNSSSPSLEKEGGGGDVNASASMITSTNIDSEDSNDYYNVENDTGSQNNVDDTDREEYLDVDVDNTSYNRVEDIEEEEVKDADDKFEEESILAEWIQLVMNNLPKGTPIPIIAVVLFASAMCCCLCLCRKKIGRCPCCCITSSHKHYSTVSKRSAASMPKGRYGYGNVNQTKSGLGLEMTNPRQNRDVELDMALGRQNWVMSLEILKEKADKGFQKRPLVNAMAFEGSWGGSEVIDEVWGMTLEVVPPESVLIHDLKCFHIHCIASGMVQNVNKFYFYSVDEQSHKYMCELTISSDTLRATCVFKQDSSSSSNNLSKVFGCIIKQMLSTR